MQKINVKGEVVQKLQKKQRMDWHDQIHYAPANVFGNKHLAKAYNFWIDAYQRRENNSAKLNLF